MRLARRRQADASRLHVSFITVVHGRKTMRGYPRVYRSFEEFEREELRRGTSLRSTVDDMLDDMFTQELDFDAEASRRSSYGDDDSDE